MQRTIKVPAGCTTIIMKFNEGADTTVAVESESSPAAEVAQAVAVAATALAETPAPAANELPAPADDKPTLTARKPRAARKPAAKKPTEAPITATVCTCQGLELVDGVLTQTRWTVPEAHGVIAMGIPKRDGKGFYNAMIYRMGINGDGVEKDEAEAIRWCRQAARGGYADARAALDRLSRKGDRHAY